MCARNCWTPPVSPPLAALRALLGAGPPHTPRGCDRKVPVLVPCVWQWGASWSLSRGHLLLRRVPRLLACSSIPPASFHSARRASSAVTPARGESCSDAPRHCRRCQGHPKPRQSIWGHPDLETPHCGGASLPQEYPNPLSVPFLSPFATRGPFPASSKQLGEDTHPQPAMPAPPQVHFVSKHQTKLKRPRWGHSSCQPVDSCCQGSFCGRLLECNKNPGRRRASPDPRGVAVQQQSLGRAGSSRTDPHPLTPFLCFCSRLSVVGSSPGQQPLCQAIRALLCLIPKVLVNLSKIKRPNTFIIV